jgi:hypothetical protein
MSKFTKIGILAVMFDEQDRLTVEDCAVELHFL